MKKRIANPATKYRCSLQHITLAKALVSFPQQQPARLAVSLSIERKRVFRGAPATPAKRQTISPLRELSRALLQCRPPPAASRGNKRMSSVSEFSEEHQRPPGRIVSLGLIRLMCPIGRIAEKAQKRRLFKPPINCRASASLPRSASDPPDA